MDNIITLDKSLASLIHYCPECGALTRPAPDFLTKAEIEVLRAVADGQSQTEIARQRFVSIKTVNGQVCELYRKLGINPSTLNGTVMLTRAALKLGLTKL